MRLKYEQSFRDGQCIKDWESDFKQERARSVCDVFLCFLGDLLYCHVLGLVFLMLYS